MEQPDPKLSDEQLELVSRLSEEELNKIDTVLMSFASTCLLYTSPSPRDRGRSRMPSSA